jgi:hypothetical protein
MLNAGCIVEAPLGLGNGAAIGADHERHAVASDEGSAVGLGAAGVGVSPTVGGETGAGEGAGESPLQPITTARNPIKNNAAVRFINASQSSGVRVGARRRCVLSPVRALRSSVIEPKGIDGAHRWHSRRISRGDLSSRTRMNSEWRSSPSRATPHDTSTSIFGFTNLNYAAQHAFLPLVGFLNARLACSSRTG